MCNQSDREPMLALVDVGQLAATALNEGCECDTCDLVRSLKTVEEINYRGRSTVGSLMLCVKILIAVVMALLIVQLVAWTVALNT